MTSKALLLTAGGDKDVSGFNLGVGFTVEISICFCGGDNKPTFTHLTTEHLTLSLGPHISLRHPACMGEQDAYKNPGRDRAPNGDGIPSSQGA